ncbi:MULTISPECIES: hypothetical protein [Bacillus]|uniref:hypothetical protein n=1 Tax=Bacillus TaxID=1386 RepID=UPI001B0191DB|nr:MULTISPECIES: hypothetical protein [Bacillus]MCY8577602.1 hypothetical protein [Bacillus haynesii]MEC1657052.1 hypothetical protein [Bacillus haynesii]MED4337857.1 hypothetical protein [Bacillus licheniformis]MED4371139.1 hypothetical protein [Bacillus licheniformis]GIN55055.1 hypothetical protein J36TS2_39490 [Bacillus paralicheniformis]
MRLYFGFAPLNWNIGFEAYLMNEGKLLRITFLPITLIIKLNNSTNGSYHPVRRIKMRPFKMSNIFKGLLLYNLFNLVIGLIWRSYEIFVFGVPQPSIFDTIISSILSLSLMLNVVYYSIIKEGKF